MLFSGYYFIFVIGASGGVQTFRCEVRANDLDGLKANWARLSVVEQLHVVTAHPLQDSPQRLRPLNVTCRSFALGCPH